MELVRLRRVAEAIHASEIPDTNPRRVVVVISCRF